MEWSFSISSFWRLSTGALSAIYDPSLDQWTKLAPPPFFRNLIPAEFVFYYGYNPPVVTLGDTSAIVLPNGKVMISNSFGFDSAILGPRNAKLERNRV